MVRTVNAVNQGSPSTRQRLLDVATAEFATHGFSGGRVNRIADLASANKERIYDYFGSKSDLFDTVIAEMIQRVNDEVPFDPYELPSYAAALHQYFARNPRDLRLDSWRRLERPAPSDAEIEMLEAKLVSIAEARSISMTAAADVLLQTYSIAAKWLTGLPALVPLAEKHTPEAGHADDIAAAVAVVLQGR